MATSIYGTALAPLRCPRRSASSGAHTVQFGVPEHIGKQNASHDNVALTDDSGDPEDMVKHSDKFDNVAHTDDSGDPEDMEKHIDEFDNESTDWVHNLEFTTPEEAKKFYDKYAHNKGFGTRIEMQKTVKTKKTPIGMVRYITLVCNKEGFRKGSILDPNNKNNTTVANQQTHVTQRSRSEDRTGCLAHVKLKLDAQKGVFVINCWVDKHNHELHPPKYAHFIRSNRRVTEVQGVVAELNSNAGIQLRSSFEVMALGAGGREILGFIPRDLKNHLSRKREKQMQFGEATALHEYFKSQQSRNPAFYYEIEVDNEEKMANIFWADAKMRMDYALFGDSITFDTTYRTNKKYRPLALFVGFNHHRQGCIFGAALLYDETKESFEWLFATFLRCMSNKFPETIFTDQDAAMPYAIEKVMPHTYHALCSWHILQNADKKLGTLLKLISTDFNYLIYGVSDEDEFNHLWKKMISEFFPDGAHHWLQWIHRFRHQWSSAWVKQHFTAGMATTQLSESCNSILRGYLQPEHNLVQFFTHFERMVASRRNAEKDQDFRAADKVPQNHFYHSPITKSAAEHYTPNMFARFLEEYQFTLDYMVVRCPKNDYHDKEAYCVYKLEDGTNENEIDERIVLVRTENVHLSCSCRLYETLGIFCRHILTLMDFLRTTGNIQMRSLPAHYIMKRWTKKAKMGMEFDITNTPNEADAVPTDYAGRYQYLCGKMVNCATVVCMDDRLFKLVTSGFDELCTRAKQMQQSLVASFGQEATPCASSGNCVTQCLGERVAKGIKIRDKPIKSRKRLKSLKEQVMQKKRCSIRRERKKEINFLSQEGNTSLSQFLNEETIQLTL